MTPKEILSSPEVNGGFWLKEIALHLAIISEKIAGQQEWKPTESLPIEALDLSKRARNVLLAHKIFTLGALCELTTEQIKLMKNSGVKTVRVIKDAVQKVGRSLREDGNAERRPSMQGKNREWLAEKWARGQDKKEQEH